jgi:hypothetical protein
MRLPLQTQEFFLNSIRRRNRFGAAVLFSGDALSYMSFRRAQTGNNGTAGRDLLGSTASLLYPCLGGPRQPLDRQL